MKKVCIVFAVFFIIIVAAAVCARPAAEEQGAYLRLHVRAHSDSAADQAVKSEVKEAIVSLLTPLAASARSKEEALCLLEGMLPAVEAAAEEALAAKGFSYGARAEVRKEEFPTRVYEEVTLEAGVYDALIVELGSGRGANWWCVLYPPLCFAGRPGESVQFRSRIWEIIQQFFSDRGDGSSLCARSMTGRTERK